MPHSFYNLLHIAGLVMLSLSLGGMLLHRQLGQGDRPKLLSILHGVGLFLILLAGFGMLARLGIHWPWPGWVFLKVALLVVLGAFPALARRFDAGLGWWVAMGLIVLAAWAGIMKPF